ncbi:hypothetical protein IE53DRAFT_378341 [Violaceomyces palustris]|uniref:Uncharacterized protein n=1 Tax=Violaceomyces palustris TaxID=1673888 RepID=A0ACD0P270_9BASI|nr:hypothetical protein IE53DRAFT_378341 [Violaceomyces palustris]
MMSDRFSLQSLRKIQEISSLFKVKIGSTILPTEASKFPVDPLYLNSDGTYCLQEELGSRPLRPETRFLITKAFEKGACDLQKTFRTQHETLTCGLQSLFVDEDERVFKLDLVKKCLEARFHGAIEELLKIIVSMIDERIAQYEQEVASSDSLQEDDEQPGRGHRSTAIAILEKAFEHTPNITQAEKYKLAEATGLLPRQVTIWFQNRRNRKAAKSKNAAAAANDPKQGQEEIGGGGGEAAATTKTATSERKRKTANLNSDVSDHPLYPGTLPSVLQPLNRQQEEHDQHHDQSKEWTKRRMLEDGRIVSSSSSSSSTSFSSSSSAAAPSGDRYTSYSSYGYIPPPHLGDPAKPRNPSGQSHSSDSSFVSSVATSLLDNFHPNPIVMHNSLLLPPPTLSVSDNVFHRKSSEMGENFNDHMLFRPDHCLPMLDLDDLGLDAITLQRTFNVNWKVAMGGVESPSIGTGAVTPKRNVDVDVATCPGTEDFNDDGWMDEDDDQAAWNGESSTLAAGKKTLRSRGKAIKHISNKAGSQVNYDDVDATPKQEDFNFQHHHQASSPKPRLSGRAIETSEASEAARQLTDSEVNILEFIFEKVHKETSGIERGRGAGSTTFSSSSSSSSSISTPGEGYTPGWWMNCDLVVSQTPPPSTLENGSVPNVDDYLSFPGESDEGKQAIAEEMDFNLASLGINEAWEENRKMMAMTMSMAPPFFHGLPSDQTQMVEVEMTDGGFW